VSLDATHIRAVVRKELRDYRRNRFIFVSMAIYPLIFVAAPIANIFALPASLSSHALHNRLGLILLFMLLIPVVVPATVASYAVVGEREQGTLEPLLTTPISSEELLLGKAAAVMIPSVAISYTAFGLVLAAVRLLAHANIASAIFNQSALLAAQAVFTPLLTGWTIWVAIAISTRSSDVRTAQQLSILASLPPVALAALISFQVVHASLTLAIGIGAGLLAIDALAWRGVSALFNRERLITGTKPATTHPHGRGTSPESTT
jgi:ABC-type Na+ efflux pump permease subunit